MNVEQHITRVWLLPVTMSTICAAVLLSTTPGSSSGESAPVELRMEPAANVITEMPEPQTAKATDAAEVHEDNHPPTF